MIKINFLPWRECLQKRKQRNFIYSVVLSLLVGLIFAFSMYYKLHNRIEIRNEFRLIGSILSKQKHWGLILLPNNQIIQVQKGDLLGKERIEVKEITATEIELLINNKLYTMSFGSDK